MPHKPSSQFAGLAHLVANDSRETQELFEYGLVDLFVRAGIVQVIKRAVVNSRKSITIKLSTVGGYLCTHNIMSHRDGTLLPGYS